MGVSQLWINRPIIAKKKKIISPPYLSFILKLFSNRSIFTLYRHFDIDIFLIVSCLEVEKGMEETRGNLRPDNLLAVK